MTNQTNKTKKVAITSAVIGTAIAASILGVSVFKSKDKPTALPQEIESGKLAAIEEILEYGEDITGKTITVNAKTGKLEVDFNKLNPEVDTMKVGKTEHTLDVEKEKFDVNVKVQDTKFPVLKDFKDEYSLKGELSEEQIKAELAKLIKAEDPVDGEVNVEFELINDGVKKLKVKVKATDLNGNVTKDETIVSLENKVVKEGKKEEESKKDESKDESTAGSKDESKSNVAVAKPSENKKPVANNQVQNNKQQGTSNTQSQTKPQPKPEAKPQPKPGAKPQPKPEAKPQPKPQPKPEVKPQPKPEVKPQPKPQPKPEVKPQPKPQPKPDTSTSKWPVPSGATVFMKTKNDIGYNYSKTISSNVTVTKVTQDFLENAIIIGTKGSHGIVTFFYKPNGSYGYYMDSNVFTAEEEKALINVAKLFLP